MMTAPLSRSPKSPPSGSESETRSPRPSEERPRCGRPTPTPGAANPSYLPRLPAALTVLAIAASSSGCHLAIEALERSNQERRDDHARVALEKACADKDLATLQKVYSSRDEDHDFAQRCVAEIKVSAILATDCELFSASFDPTDERAKPDVHFKLAAYKDPEERSDRARKLAEKALECKTTRFLLGPNAARSTEVDWASIVDGLDQDRVYSLLRDDLKDRSGVVASGSAEVAVSWLMRTQTKSRCADLVDVTRDPKKPHPWRGVLLPFFVGKKCELETKAVASELLSSSWAEDRMDACRALQGLGDKSQLSKMKRLATTDPARSLERQRAGVWEYAFVTHPVREVCQGAVNQLELRDSH
jgi:hypothetical protein